MFVLFVEVEKKKKKSININVIYYVTNRNNPIVTV